MRKLQNIILAAALICITVMVIVLFAVAISNLIKLL